MKTERAELGRAADALYNRIATDLARDGWVRRPLNVPSLTAFTHERPDGRLAVLSVSEPVFSHPAAWPVRLRVRYGAGWEPALDLSPLLTLRPTVSLVEHERADDAELPDAAAVAATAGEIVSLAPRAVEFRDSFADLPALLAAVDRADARTWLLVLLAAGRREEAVAVLDTNPELDGRFVRQVQRRLDSSLAVPPFAETMALLPTLPRLELPSWSQSKTQSHAKQDAISAVRVQRRGKSADELRQLLSAELGSRGVELSDSVIEALVSQLLMEQRPFGRAVSTLKAVNLLATGATRLVRIARGQNPPAPDWVRLPATAAYWVPKAPGGIAVGVEIDRSAQEFVNRMVEEVPSLLPDLVSVSAWLTDGGDGRIAVHIGTQRVGLLPAKNSVTFQRHLMAAALFDEQPFVSATVFRARGRNAIELDRPARGETEE